MEMREKTRGGRLRGRGVILVEVGRRDGMFRTHLLQKQRLPTEVSHARNEIDSSATCKLHDHEQEIRDFDSSSRDSLPCLSMDANHPLHPRRGFIFDAIIATLVCNHQRLSHADLASLAAPHINESAGTQTSQRLMRPSSNYL